LVILNFSSQDQKVSIPELGTGRITLSTSLDRSEQVDLRDLTLKGDEGLIVELE